MFLFDCPEGHVGMERVIRRFLFFPKKLCGRWKWLGIADIIQESVKYNEKCYKCHWVDVGWDDHLSCTCHIKGRSK